MYERRRKKRLSRDTWSFCTKISSGRKLKPKSEQLGVKEKCNLSWMTELQAISSIILIESRIYVSYSSSAVVFDTNSNIIIYNTHYSSKSQKSPKPKNSLPRFGENKMCETSRAKVATCEGEF